MGRKYDVFIFLSDFCFLIHRNTYTSYRPILGYIHNFKIGCGLNYILRTVIAEGTTRGGSSHSQELLKSESQSAQVQLASDKMMHLFLVPFHSCKLGPRGAPRHLANLQTQQQGDYSIWKNIISLSKSRSYPT